MNFIRAILRIRTQGADFQKALRTVVPIRSQRYGRIYF